MKKETNCPTCNNPRVGIVNGNNYSIVAGTIIKGKKASCDFVGYHTDSRQKYWYDNQGKVLEGKPINCPLCGEKLETECIKEIVYGSYCRSYEKWVNWLICPNSRDSKDKFCPINNTCPDCEQHKTVIAGWYDW